MSQSCLTCGSTYILKDSKCVVCWLKEHVPDASDELMAYLEKVLKRDHNGETNEMVSNKETIK